MEPIAHPTALPTGFVRTAKAWIRFGVIVFITTLACTSPTISETLLPSQERDGFFTAKICQDRQVLSIIGSSIDAVLHTKSVLAKGMQADDIRLEAVNAKQSAVLCSMTVAAKGLIETVTYVIRAEGESFFIVLSGNKGSKLFPNEITMRPAN
jgi:hypothetical protein